MAFIQTTAKFRVTNSTASPETFNFPGAVTAGNTCIVSLSYFQSSSAFVTAITVGGTAASLITRHTDAAGTSIEFWRAQNVAGGTTACTITSSASAHYYAGSAEEWSGVQTAAADIVANTGTGTSTAPSATYGTLAQADELIYVGYTDTTGTAETTVNPPAGYTTAYTELDGVNQIGGSSAYRVVSSATGASPTFSINASTGWNSALATFKLTVAPSSNTLMGQAWT